MGISHIKHGGCVTEVSTEYKSWTAMRSRCYDPKNIAYDRYGGSGKTVFGSWRKDFGKFLSYMGRKPTPQHTIDLWPNRNGNYEPGNVRWANRSEQMENRGITRFVTANGETKTCAEWARIKGIDIHKIYGRLKRGWTQEDAVNLPTGTFCMPTGTASPNYGKKKRADMKAGRRIVTPAINPIESVTVKEEQA